MSGTEKRPEERLNESVTALRENACRLRTLADTEAMIGADARTELYDVAGNMVFLSGEFTRSFTGGVWRTSKQSAHMMAEAFKPLTALASSTQEKQPPQMGAAIVLTALSATVALAASAFLIAWFAKGEHTMVVSDTEVFDRIEQMIRREPNLSAHLIKYGEKNKSGRRPGTWGCRLVAPDGFMWIEGDGPSPAEATRECWVKFQEQMKSWGNRQRW
jgi:hypothetical protein